MSLWLLTVKVLMTLPRPPLPLGLINGRINFLLLQRPWYLYPDPSLSEKGLCCTRNGCFCVLRPSNRNKNVVPLIPTRNRETDDHKPRNGQLHRNRINLEEIRCSVLGSLLRHVLHPNPDSPPFHRNHLRTLL